MVIYLCTVLANQQTVILKLNKGIQLCFILNENFVCDLKHLSKKKKKHYSISALKIIYNT